MEYPRCKLCKKNQVRVVRKYNENKTVKSQWVGDSCWTCHRGFSKAPRSYAKHKKPSCQECGFVAIHSIQLDIDHIDGNKENESPENLINLCANCHRLKSLLANDCINLRFRTV